MSGKREGGRNFLTLKNKLILLLLVVVLPFLCITMYLISSLRSYSKAYESIVNNMTTANTYNLNFKDEMDENLYLMVARNLTASELAEQEDGSNPYTLIQELRLSCKELMKITNDSHSRVWLRRLIRNVDTLEDRVDDISENLEAGGRYDANIEMLDKNIYILTELIQDDIQYYIYYQTKNIALLKDELNHEIGRFVFVVSIFLISILAIVVTFAIVIARGIIKPVSNLVGVTEQISQGDFSVRADITSKDEIGMLSESVNEMTQHLEELVSTIKEDERRMRHTELRLLQEQINPHFLYNTLDTIVWLIESGKADSAEDMVVSLSSFFRLVLSHGQELISIGEEAKHIQSYLEIQQVRYKDILDYDISIDSELYPFEILKLTLQPIVENALYHGIKYKRAKGTIKVTGQKRNDTIVLTVSDDGVGMDLAELEHLRQEIQKPCQETDSGFGLANVNERIRMNFGSEYGVMIDSVLGEGTTVKVIIPASVKSSEKDGKKQLDE